jgi:cytosine deaminase
VVLPELDLGGGVPAFAFAPRGWFHVRVDPFLGAAIEEARRSLAAGGIPIGSVLVLDGHIIGRGHNRRVQDGSAIHHAGMNCLENAGRRPASIYRRSGPSSTLSPYPMCSGAALLYKIPRIVVGENVTFRGPEDYVRAQGVSLQVLQDPVCIQLMEGFIAARPELWNEDIGA